MADGTQLTTVVSDLWYMAKVAGSRVWGGWSAPCNRPETVCDRLPQMGPQDTRFNPDICQGAELTRAVHSHLAAAVRQLQNALPG